MIDMTKTYPIDESDLARMNIGRQFWRVKLDAIPDRCAYKKMVARWIERMPEMFEKGIGMVLHGELRQGKTSSAVICLKAVAAHGGTGYIIRADGVAGAVVGKKMFDEDQTVEERCQTVDLLVIDDLYQEGGYEQTRAMIERLVRWRYDHRKSMLVTTNNLKGLKEKCGEGTALVILSRCLPIEVKGTQFLDIEKKEVVETFSDDKRS